jgi:ferritin-like metal-binding protein YciE
MPAIDSLRTLLVEQLKDIYDAEKRLTKAIPKLIKNSTNDDLKTALRDHLDQTEEHVARIERAFDELDLRPKTKACTGMKGLVEETTEHVAAEYDDDGLRDAAIIGAAQRVEHYEIAAYGTLIAHARLLELDGIVSLLEETLDEEKAADRKLTEIAENVVNLEAASSDEEPMPAPSGLQYGARRGLVMLGRGIGTRASASDRGRVRGTGRR